MNLRRANVLALLCCIRFFNRLERMTGSKSGTGGAITFQDSGWEIYLVIYDREYYPDQGEKNRDVLWGDGAEIKP